MQCTCTVKTTHICHVCTSSDRLRLAA